MTTKKKKPAPIKKPSLADTLCEQANPMAMRGILNFLLVCKYAGLENIGDDAEDNALELSLLSEVPREVKETLLRTYPLDANYNLVMMLAEVLVPSMFVEGSITPGSVRRVQPNCYANPFYPDEGNASEIYKKALKVLEEHGCIRRVESSPEKTKAKTKVVIFEITEKGTDVLSGLIKRADTIRDFDKEAEHEVAQAIMDGRHQEADALTAAQLARDAEAKAAEVEKEKMLKAERIRQATEQGAQKKVVHKAAVPPAKQAVVVNKPHEKPVLSAEELTASKLRAEHGVLKFMHWKNAFDEDHAVYSGDIKLAVYSRADQHGWANGRGQNPYQSTFDVLDAVVTQMANGESPLIAADRNSVDGNKIYYYLTNAGIARLKELDEQAQMPEKKGAVR